MAKFNVVRSPANPDRFFVMSGDKAVAQGSYKGRSDADIISAVQGVAKPKPSKPAWMPAPAREATGKVAPPIPAGAKRAMKMGMGDIEKAKQIADLEKKYAPSETEKKVITGFDQVIKIMDPLSLGFKDMAKSTERSLEGTPFKGLAGQTSMAAGPINRLLGWTKANEAVSSYEGTMHDTAMSLVKVALPGTRGSAEMVKMLEETLPDIGSTWGEYARQLSQTIHKAYRIREAWTGEQFNRAAIQKHVNEGILKKAMPQKELKRFMKESGDIYTGKVKGASIEKILDVAKKTKLDAEIERLERELEGSQ